MREGCRVRVSGPLAGYADGFWDELAAHGYTGQVRDRNVRMLAHVSRWMIERGLSRPGYLPTGGTGWPGRTA